MSTPERHTLEALDTSYVLTAPSTDGGASIRLYVHDGRVWTIGTDGVVIFSGFTLPAVAHMLEKGDLLEIHHD